MRICLRYFRCFQRNQGRIFSVPMLACALSVLFTQFSVEGGEFRRFVLLRNGEVLNGTIDRDEDHYIVRRTGSARLRIPYKDISHVGASLHELYLHKSDRIIEFRADEHLELASWCLQHGIETQATHHILRAETLSPFHPHLSLLKARLELSLSKANGMESLGDEIALQAAVKYRPLATLQNPGVSSIWNRPLATDDATHEISGTTLTAQLGGQQPMLQRRARFVSPIARLLAQQPLRMGRVGEIRDHLPMKALELEFGPPKNLRSPSIDTIAKAVELPPAPLERNLAATKTYDIDFEDSLAQGLGVEFSKEVRGLKPRLTAKAAILSNVDLYPSFLSESDHWTSTGRLRAPDFIVAPEQTVLVNQIVLPELMPRNLTNEKADESAPQTQRTKRAGAFQPSDNSPVAVSHELPVPDSNNELVRDVEGQLANLASQTASRLPSDSEGLASRDAPEEIQKAVEVEEAKEESKQGFRTRSVDPSVLSSFPKSLSQSDRSPIVSQTPIASTPTGKLDATDREAIEESKLKDTSLETPLVVQPKPVEALPELLVAEPSLERTIESAFPEKVVGSTESSSQPESTEEAAGDTPTPTAADEFALVATTDASVAQSNESEPLANTIAANHPAENHPAENHRDGNETAANRNLDDAPGSDSEYVVTNDAANVSFAPADNPTGIVPTDTEVIAASLRDAEPRAVESNAPSIDLPPELIRAYVANIQPLLVTRCGAGNCHGANTPTNFLLEPVAHHRPSRSTTMRNLAATLDQLDKQRPVDSPLFTWGQSIHGDTQSRVLAVSDVRQQTMLLNWIQSVANPPKPPRTKEEVVRDRQRAFADGAERISLRKIKEGQVRWQDPGQQNRSGWRTTEPTVRKSSHFEFSREIDRTQP